MTLAPAAAVAAFAIAGWAVRAAAIATGFGFMTLPRVGTIIIMILGARWRGPVGPSP